jgi:27-O-demethylrifamycin SV methyltransferase
MANGFADSSFDRVWIMESSHLMPHKNELIAESARVLRPGGQLILCDIILRSKIPLAELVRNLGAFKSLDVVFGKAKMELLETYGNLAQDNGLVVSRSEDVSDAVLPTFEHWRKNARDHRSQIVELVGEDYWERFLAACDSLTTLWEQGKLGYGILLASKQGG